MNEKLGVCVPFVFVLVSVAALHRLPCYSFVVNDPAHTSGASSRLPWIRNDRKGLQWLDLAWRTLLRFDWTKFPRPL